MRGGTPRASSGRNLKKILRPSLGEHLDRVENWSHTVTFGSFSMKMILYSLLGVVVLAATVLVISGCASNSPLNTPARVDLNRFMGTWYVLGYTPLVVDKDAHNGIEHYYLAENGDIETTYQFRKGSFDGELKTLTPVGRVFDQETNAEWRMQFIWPFKSQYVIMDVSDDYTRTIVAHPNRKYAWIMARTANIPEGEYQRMLGQLEKAGFDCSAILRLPQDWAGEEERLRRIREAAEDGRLPVD